MIIQTILQNEELYYIEGNVISSARFEANNAKYYSYNKETRKSTSTLVADNNVSAAAYKYDEFGSTELVGSTTIENELKAFEKVTVKDLLKTGKRIFKSENISIYVENNSNIERKYKVKDCIYKMKEAL